MATAVRRVLPGAPLGVGHVDPRLPGLDQAQAHLGRILEIGVHDDHRVAVGHRVDARSDRDLVSEVARERQHAHPVVGGGQLEQEVEGAVTAPVVDLDELEGQVAPTPGDGQQ